MKHRTVKELAKEMGAARIGSWVSYLGKPQKVTSVWFSCRDIDEEIGLSVQVLYHTDRTVRWFLHGAYLGSSNLESEFQLLEWSSTLKNAYDFIQKVRNGNNETSKRMDT